MVPHLRQVTEGLIDVVDIVDCKNMGFWSCSRESRVRMFRCPLFQVVRQMCLPYEALAHAVTAGRLVACAECSTRGMSALVLVGPQACTQLAAALLSC